MKRIMFILITLVILPSALSACDKVSSYYRSQIQKLEQESMCIQRENRQLQTIISEMGREQEQLASEIIKARSSEQQAQFALLKKVNKKPAYDYKSFLQHNPEAKKYFPYILEAVEHHKDTWPVDPLYALSIVKQESNFGEYIVSKAGALGDFQFIEKTARKYGVHGKEPLYWKQAQKKYRLAMKKRGEAYELLEKGLKNIQEKLEEQTLL